MFDFLLKVTRTYLYACWSSFLIAFFGRKDLTDFYDFGISHNLNDGTLRKCYWFSFRYKSVWDIGPYWKPRLFCWICGKICRGIWELFSFFVKTSFSKAKILALTDKKPCNSIFFISLMKLQIIAESSSQN